MMAKQLERVAEAVRTVPIALAVRCSLAAASVAAGLGEAAAQTVTNDAAGVAKRVKGQFGAFADLIGAGAFLCGIGFVVFGIFRLYTHSKNPNDPSGKLSTAVILIVAGGAMIAVPTVAGVGVTSLFGEGAKTVGAETGNELRSLGRTTR